LGGTRSTLHFTSLHSSRDMAKLCVLLFLLPVADARLRGFTPPGSPDTEAPSQEIPATILCDQQSSKTPQDEFDELALLQQEMTPSQGMHQKSHEEWLAHAAEADKSKISADEGFLHIDSVAGQLSKISSDGCADDPMWRDADGDGCEIYRFAIASGKITFEAACSVGAEVPPAGGLRGSLVRVVADATARVFCPITCGMCQPVATEEQSGEGLDDVAFLQVGVSSASGVYKKTVESWEEEHLSDHESRITSDQRALDNETVALQLAKLQKGEGCADDPMWRDADGDGCEIYRFVIESGSTREIACNGGGEDPPSRGLRGSVVVADATAKVFCPVTCGVC